ncbi:alpha/beta fold hydrolase [Enterococcus sp. 669A]|uniref:Alpha/beta fold hydrolase n=1 Tax=Candidatus Enterococcus moelleringii TaxID=2815325 RepID=A0ABS3LFA0_9ENTE|nr:alpha/beta hydrolase [Enterococcus sp. 669A]MBO1308319.1 alpha/beta fold hydrolase [Enterococcus sp. 669A]
MKKFIAGVILIIGLLLISGCQRNDRQTTVSSRGEQTTISTETLKKTATPTLFIHGYSGTVNSFGGMISRFEGQQLAKKELVITVQADGTLQVDGSFSHSNSNPMVQVLFADNTNNEWNQTDWIYTVLKYLKNQGVDQTNIVGHSMGGVSSLRYLTTYGEPEDAAKVVKLIAIGSPFNDLVDTSDEQTVENLLESGPTQKASRYMDYQNGVSNIPENLSILLLAGKLNETTLNDETVPTTSALSVYSLLKENSIPVEQQVYTGPKAQHSQLHENLAVDKKIAEELWEPRK